MNIHFNKEEKNRMISAYLSGNTQKESAALIGTSQQICSEELKRRSIPSRSKYGTRKYFVDESFFDKIDTEEKAYVLGFLTADGCISLSGRANRIIWKINKKDIDVLKKIKTCMKSEHKIYYRRTETSEMCILEINSKRIISSLKKLGITKKKTFTVKPCTKIKYNLLKHYYRGLIDGDGCLSKCNYHKNRNIYSEWQIGLTGNKYIISGFKGFVYRNLKIGNKINIYSDRNSYGIKYSAKSDTRKIANLLYKNTSIYLNRKKKLADKLLKDN